VRCGDVVVKPAIERLTGGRVCSVDRSGERKLLPNGGTPSPQEQAKQLQEALKFAACIRSHGMPDYPDPKISSDGGIEMGEAPSSPQFNAAEKGVSTTTSAVRVSRSALNAVTPPLSTPCAR
jgi:hypothetical protein